ncbi:MAG: type II secretion system F family protein [Phycisphaerales bacterium]|nr:type II secretion system F family protein [Phycisphaerales bacterium]
MQLDANATFVFRAIDAQGRESSGTISAPSAAEVAFRLRREGKTVLEVARDALARGNASDATETTASRSMFTSSRVRRTDAIDLCRQVGVMVETGVGIVEALDAYATEGARPEFKEIVESVRLEVSSGVPLSQAFAKRPHAFPPVVAALTRAAEATGQLGEMLARAAEHLARIEKIRRQVKAAATYPMFMLGTGMLIVSLLVAFVLPRFAKLYEDRGAELPALTKALLWVGRTIGTHGLSILIVVAALVTAFVFWNRSESARHFFDRLRFGFPIIGRLVRAAFVARSMRTLSTLLSSGIHLLDAIAIVRGLDRSPRTERFWSSVDASVREGRLLAESVRREGLLPATVASMIAAGERGGRLPDVLERVATFAEEDLEIAIKQAMSLLEPILVVVLGSVLGGLAIALLLPLFSLSKVVAGNS